tara:strand:- start:197 stop:1501 length:1305 start_codon:yes stop_codon:yes gene_type:complete
MPLITFLLVLFIHSYALADEWPQWMGPNRDNVWKEKGIVSDFNDEGPRILWKAEIAGGYSGPAVADGSVYVTDYVTSDDVKVANFDRKQFTGTERVLCLDENTGKEIWKHEYPVKYSISYPAGPRCTPNYNKGHVYTLGAEGNLFCFEAKTGKVIWSKNLPEEYKTKTPLWGYAAHPLIDGDKLITLAGGEGSHCIAINLKTGKEVWRTLTSREQGYSPPTIINAGGTRQLILAHPEGVSSVNPESGKEYWTQPYEASNGSIIMSPLHHANLLYVGGYSNKNILIQLDPQKAESKTVWRDQPRMAISPVNVQPFLIDETIIGLDQNGFMYGIDLPTGERLWETSEPLHSERPLGSGTALMVKNGDRFFLFNEHGELIIAKISREGYEEIDSMKVIEPTNVAFGRNVVWSAPAYANKSAFIRNDNQCIRLDLSAE